MSIDKNGNSLMDNLFNMNINFNLKLLENPNVKSEHANAQVISIILPEYTDKNIKIHNGQLYKTCIHLYYN